MVNNDRPQVLESLMLIANLAHAEIHLGELAERTHDTELITRLHARIGMLRKLRAHDLEQLGEKGRILWCSVKHLCLAYVSCHEMAAKTGSTGYYARAGEIMSIIDELMSDEGINELNVSRCPRCDEHVSEIQEASIPTTTSGGHHGRRTGHKAG